MNKEEIKEDIISDINRLLSKDGKEDNINELFNNANEKQVQQNSQVMPQQNPQVMPQQKVSMQNPQLNPQLNPQQMQQMHQQMQQQQMQQQIQQQMQQQQMQQQIQQQQMQQQMHHPHMPGHLHQLTPQQQQQIMHQQLLQQGINPQMLQQQRLNPMLVREHMANQNNSSDNINNIIFSNRDSLVLFLLYIILLTPQINSLMNKIPYTSDHDNYPGYLGILLRGIIFISLYIGMKSLNLI